MLRVTNWREIYENNRTRGLKKLEWIPVPNRFDGDGYTELVTEHKDGPAHFAVWMVILQLASKCDVRGVLAKSTGEPHDSKSIARITRFPERLIHAAIPRLKKVGWLQEVPATSLIPHDPAGGCGIVPIQNGSIPQEGAGIPQEGAALTRAEAHSLRTEGNGRERKGIVVVGSGAARPTDNGRRIDIAQLLTDFMGTRPDDGIVLRVDDAMGHAHQEELRNFLRAREPSAFQRKRSPWAYLATAVESEFKSIARKYAVTDETEHA